MLPTPPEGLRHWRADDAAALRSAWADPDITRWNPPPPSLDPAAWIAGAEERWTRRLALDLVIETWKERADRRDASLGGKERADRSVASVAGEVGLSGFTTGPDRAELGVWVAAPHRRTGLASLAVATVSRWALTELAVDQLWARTDPANTAAEALFDRLAWDRLGTSGGRTIWSATTALLR